VGVLSAAGTSYLSFYDVSLVRLTGGRVATGSVVGFVYGTALVVTIVAVDFGAAPFVASFLGMDTGSRTSLIAIALACRPHLLIADEPTTALDVTIQAEILELLDGLQRQMGMAVLLITHNLGLVAERTKRVYVMYAGQIVESAPTEALFAAPAHPYTQGLMAAVPRPDAPRERLAAIPGQVPPATAWPAGCRFHPRCPLAWERCRAELPPLLPAGAGREARCWLLADGPHVEAAP
jgi:oligopeptide/dipeptide ABC transporter ATP-binding protein